MTLGNRIQQLRKEHNLSQGELADALNVSRQSVSKWETDATIPDLEKLLKLSNLFQISLDELVKGTAKSIENQSISEKSNESSIAQKTIENTPTIPIAIQSKILPRQIAGILLCCMAFLTILFCTITNLFFSGLILSIPFLVCSLICFFIKQHPGLYCAWALAIMLDLFMRFASGAHWNIIFYPMYYLGGKFSMQLLVGWIQFLFLVVLIVITIHTFRDLNITFTKPQEKYLFLSWIVYLLLHVPLPQHIVLRLLTDYSMLFVIYQIMTGTIRIILFTFLIIVTRSLYRQYKEKKDQSI